MADIKDFLKKTVDIGQKIKAFSFFSDSDYVRLSDEADTVLTRASYPELSAKFPTGRFSNAQLEATLDNPVYVGSGEGFGQYHAISGDGTRCIISEWATDTATLINTGEVHIYRQDSYGTWTLEQTLSLTPKDNFDNFGITVKIDYTGTRVIVSWDRDIPYVQSGAVNVYSRSGTTWSLEQQINIPTDSGSGADRFGRAVDISKNAEFMVVGAEHYFGAGGDQEGRAWVFSRNGTTWTLRDTIINPDQTGVRYFAEGVAMDDKGETIAITHRLKDSPFENDAGAVEIYQRRTPTDIPNEGEFAVQFEHMQTVYAPREFDGFNKGFGGYEQIAMSGDGNTIAIGHQNAERFGDTGCGGVLILERQRQSASHHAHAMYKPAWTSTVDATRPEVLRLPRGYFEPIQFIPGFQKQGTLEFFGRTLGLSGDGSTLVVYAFIDEYLEPDSTTEQYQHGAQFVFKRNKNAEGYQQRAFVLKDYIQCPSLRNNNYMTHGSWVSVDYYGDRLITGALRYSNLGLNDGRAWIHSYIDTSATDLRFPREEYNEDDICDFIKVK